MMFAPPDTGGVSASSCDSWLTPQSGMGASWICTWRPSLAGRLVMKRIEQLNTMVRSTWSSWSFTSMTFTRRAGPLVGSCAKAPRAPSAASSISARRQSRPSAMERRIRHSMMRSGQTSCNGGLRRVAVDVAGATAVGELGGGVGETLDRLRVRRGLEVLRMAAGAGAGVRRRGVRHLVGVGGVAAGAAQRGAMRSRVSGAGVPEADEAPVRVAVTGGAVAPGDHVPGREADGAAVVVAGGAAADKARVIDKSGFPCERAVADIALRGGMGVSARYAARLHGLVDVNGGTS